MSSLRRTLLATLLAAVAAVTVAASFLVYRVVRREVDALLDYQLRQMVLSLAGRAPGGAVIGGADERLDVVIQIWDQDGLRLYLSKPGSGLPEAAELGFSTVPSPAGPWRAYAAEISGLVVQVAQPERVRRELAFAAVSRALAPVALSLPLLALLVWRIVGRALRPLEALARSVGARTPAALEPIAEAPAPAEVLPLVRSLNALLSRLRAALSAQRAFVADAAHELRTPLAALDLQAQLVSRAGDEAERAAALADLRAGLRRAAHVVDQLLALARAEPEAAAALADARVPLAELARQAVADHALLAEARGVDLGAAELAEGAVASGDPAALRTLLANLVDNAVRYTLAGGRVDVAAGVSEGRPWLEVADSGPGIPAAERARAFDRFHRRGAAQEPGSGLGLAIVKAIADRHGATVRLGDAPAGGLSARVEFPAAPPAPRRPVGAAEEAPPPDRRRAGRP